MNDLRRHEWLLLFLRSPGGPYRTDQIRVMKGMFLLSQEGPGELQNLYRFVPYHYGPFDTTVYQDLDQLENAGLIRSDLVAESRQRSYDLTERGRQFIDRRLSEFNRTGIEAVRNIKHRVTSLSFLDLLNYVYERYPDYAVKSVAKK